MIKKCLFCESEFEPDKNHPYQIYCSEDCANRNYNIKNSYHQKYYIKNRERDRKKRKDWAIKNRENSIIQLRERHKKEIEKENKIRNLQGLPLVGEGFKNEMRLLFFIHKIFNGFEIMTHHRRWNKWSQTGLELDIYIPELKLAFEYMGKQHYNKDSFNALSKINRTKEEFEYQQYKDRCKKRICKLKGIVLIKIRYDEKLSEELVRDKIKWFRLNKECYPEAFVANTKQDNYLGGVLLGNTNLDGNHINNLYLTEYNTAST